MANSKVCVLSNDVLCKLKQYGWIPRQRSLSIVILEIIERMEKAENTIREKQTEYTDNANQNREFAEKAFDLLKKNGVK